MPATPHIEKHFTASDTVRDLVIGMSDGLTVPFALAAGLSGAIDSNAIIVTAGVAEIAAGAIAMGLGGYLAGRSDAEHYASERRREQMEVDQKPEAEVREVKEVFREYGLSEEEMAPVVSALTSKPRAWVDFMMRFELGLEKPDPRRARRSALTIGGAYVAGGMIPLSPYMTLPSPRAALWSSILLTAAALMLFGYIKAQFTGVKPVRSALQTLLIGGLAAAAAFSLASYIA
jgi:VIT1/CCC1 family predicted Fe2+/Mn2+ transporter